MTEVEYMQAFFGLISAFALGALVGLNWKTEQIRKKVEKDAYEQGKLDGKLECFGELLFASIAKREPENAGGNAGG